MVPFVSCYHTALLMFQYLNSSFFCGESGWVGFLVVCFLYKTNPNRRKTICCGKQWRKCHFQPDVSWVGLALGWGVRRFHNNIHSICFPTQQNLVNRKHRINRR